MVDSCSYLIPISPWLCPICLISHAAMIDNLKMGSTWFI